MKKNTLFSILPALLPILFLIPLVSHAQEFKSIVGIPGVTENSTNLSEYINALYTLSIGIAAFLAVIKIILGGVQYMMSDIITTKAAAKENIGNAFLGLLIVIGAATILNTINPNLLKLDVLENVTKINITQAPVTDSDIAKCKGNGAGIVTYDKNGKPTDCIRKTNQENIVSSGDDEYDFFVTGHASPIQVRDFTLKNEFGDKEVFFIVGDKAPITVTNKQSSICDEKGGELRRIGVTHRACVKK